MNSCQNFKRRLANLVLMAITHFTLTRKKNSTETCFLNTCYSSKLQSRCRQTLSVGQSLCHLTETQALAFQTRLLLLRLAVARHCEPALIPELSPCRISPEHRSSWWCRGVSRCVVRVDEVSSAPRNNLTTVSHTTLYTHVSMQRTRTAVLNRNLFDRV